MGKVKEATEKKGGQYLLWSLSLHGLQPEQSYSSAGTTRTDQAIAVPVQPEQSYSNAGTTRTEL